MNSGPITNDFGRTIVALKLVALHAISIVTFATSTSRMRRVRLNRRELVGLNHYVEIFSDISELTMYMLLHITLIVRLRPRYNASHDRRTWVFGTSLSPLILTPLMHLQPMMSLGRRVKQWGLRIEQTHSVMS